MQLFRLLAITGFALFLFSGQSLADFCGDGVVNGTEQCDDGNFEDRDGCNARCEIEDLEPPAVESISIAKGATNIDTTTSQITVVFTEALNQTSVSDDNTKVLHAGQPLDIEIEFEDERTMLINIAQELFSEAEHAVSIQYIIDEDGDVMTEKYVSNFFTAKAIDRTPPNVVSKPEGGLFHFPQEVALKAYVGEYTGSDEFLDETATIYYTINSVNPTTSSPVYDDKLTVEHNTTIRFFATDDKGNRSETKSVTFEFGCPDLAHAKSSSRYPRCKILECNPGFFLQNNICIQRTGGDSDYKSNAVTAPLLPSETSLTISTKPAIRITKEHKGVIPRPVVFKDKTTGITLKFPKNTKITTADGEPFEGFIIPPKTLSIKNYPIHFGYTTRSILEFKADDGRDLIFHPHYEIFIPYSGGFDTDEESKVFLYDADNSRYRSYNRDGFGTNLAEQELSIIATETNTFFVAQKGKNFNRAVFKDTVNHWSQYYAEQLYRRGIVKGKAPGVYAPNDPLTRAEFTKIVLNAIGAEIENPDDITETHFRDVPVYSWYGPYVKKAKEMGLIKGYNDKTFRPDRHINRAEAAKLLMTAFEFDLSHREETEEELQPTAERFVDLPENAWFFEFVDFAYQNELLSGLKDAVGRPLRTFAPGRLMTRGEMAKFAITTLELSEKIKKK